MKQDIGLNNGVETCLQKIFKNNDYLLLKLVFQPLDRIDQDISSIKMSVRQNQLSSQLTRSSKRLSKRSLSQKIAFGDKSQQKKNLINDLSNKLKRKFYPDCLSMEIIKNLDILYLFSCLSIANDFGITITQTIILDHLFDRLSEQNFSLFVLTSADEGNISNIYVQFLNSKPCKLLEFLCPSSAYQQEEQKNLVDNWPDKMTENNILAEKPLGQPERHEPMTYRSKFTSKLQEKS